jgi:error-prone DNA polymerase
MSMLPRLKPKEFYDLVIEVAIVRPGPIQGDMVHPYLRRREGKDRVDYPSPKPPHDQNELKGILEKTLGVPLFQEQAMRLAIKAADFSDADANRLRRSMATFKNLGNVSDFKARFVEGMADRGYDREFAERCFKQIEGFGSYGFPESHAISFALLVYASAWVKWRWPDAFLASLLNSQPMGFYQPAQLVRDAREHQVEVRGPDVLVSDWDCTLEDRPDERLRAVRLGLRQIKGFSEQEAKRLVAAREAGVRSIEDFAVQAGLTRRSLELLAEADAFVSLGLSRRQALWAVKGLADETGSLKNAPLLAAMGVKERQVELPLMSCPGSHRGLSHHQPVTARPSLRLLRESLTNLGAVKAKDLVKLPDRKLVSVGGLVLCASGRARPRASPS